MDDALTSPERPWENIKKRSDAGKMGPFFPPHQGERDASAEEAPQVEGVSAEVTDRGPSPSAPRVKGLGGVDTHADESDDDGDEKSGSSDDERLTYNSAKGPTENLGFD